MKITENKLNIIRWNGFFFLSLYQTLKQNIMKKYQVLSPDGITIEFDNPFYRSMKKAKEAFTNWIKRYGVQGYYSSNNGRIPLDELESYCQFKTITN